MKTKELKKNIEDLERKLIIKIDEMHQEDGNYIRVCDRLEENRGYVYRIVNGQARLSPNKAIEWAIKLGIENIGE
jgi:hypothetical protein